MKRFWVSLGSAGDTASNRYRLAGSARLVITDGSAVLLDVRQGKYFALTASAAMICECLKTPLSALEVAERLSHHFHRPLEKLDADVKKFLAQMVSRRLCEVV